MHNHASAMRKLMESLDEAGRMEHPDVSYSQEEKKGVVTKVIANLTSYQSGRYTKLGRNLKRIEWLSDKISQLKEQTKQESRELVADLFNAEDAVATRVVDTVSFTFQLTKDPKPTETVKYAKVLEELQEHLTPELLKVMETLVEKHSSVTQKSPALSTTDKRATESVVTEGPMDKLKGFFAHLLSKVQGWGKRYDSQLAALKAEAGIHEAVEERVEFDGRDIQLDRAFRILCDELNVHDSAQNNLMYKLERDGNISKHVDPRNPITRWGADAWNKLNAAVSGFFRVGYANGVLTIEATA